MTEVTDLIKIYYSDMKNKLSVPSCQQPASGQKSFLKLFLRIKNTGPIVQIIKAEMDINIPVLLEKNLLNTAPVYPIKAEISNSNIIKMRLRSIGLSSDIAIANFSMGYSCNKRRESKNMPS